MFQVSTVFSSSPRLKRQLIEIIEKKVIESNDIDTMFIGKAVLWTDIPDPPSAKTLQRLIRSVVVSLLYFTWCTEKCKYRQVLMVQ